MSFVKKPDWLFTPGTVSPEVKDLSNDPFFIKKAENSRKTIERCGLPKEWVEEMKATSKTTIAKKKKKPFQ